jgi:hypothetical protein
MLLSFAGGRLTYHNKREICRDCGKERNVHYRNADGSMTCWPCGRKDPKRWETCSGRCGELKHVYLREDGNPVCVDCAKQHGIHSST